MLNAELIDSIETQKYKQNPWNPKYLLGLYFTAMHEFSDELFIYYGIKKSSKADIKWHKAMHALHDGQSALLQLIKEQEITINIPSSRPLPSIRFRWSAIKHALFSRAKEAHQLINQAPYSKSTAFTYGFLELEAKTLSTGACANLVAKSCMRHITLNKTSRWMLPVRIKEDHGVSASYLGININSNDSTQTTEAQIKSRLSNDEHLGFYFIAKLILKLGRPFLIYFTKKSLQKKKSHWLGVFSSLGNIGDSTDINDLFVLAPVRWHRPIGVLFYQFNQKQYIVISLHASLKGSNVKDIINDVRQAIQLH